MYSPPLFGFDHHCAVAIGTVNTEQLRARMFAVRVQSL
jgi:hypothetical protein